jgi:hypothetical protein
MKRSWRVLELGGRKQQLSEELPFHLLLLDNYDG